MPGTRLAWIVVAVALCAVVVPAPSPALASPRGTSHEVADAFDRWEATVAEVRLAARRVASAERALEPARRAVAHAASVRDGSLADLSRHDDEMASAEQAIGDALERAREAGARVAASEAAIEAAREALLAHSSDVRAAGEAATPPDMREESRIRHRSGDVLLARAVAEHESAEADHAARLADVVHATRRREVAGTQRPALEEALAGTLDDLDAAKAEQDALTLEVDRRREELAARQADHDAALSGMRNLGWRAGVLGRGGLVWPTDGAPGSRFGPRRHPITRRVRLHAGVDVPAPTGQNVVATAAGRVTFAGRNGGYGFMVDVAHSDGRMSRYAHLSYISVRVGDRVEQAQRIGKVGSTGASTGPHLHFEVRVHGKPRDPLDWFSGAVRGPRRGR